MPLDKYIPPPLTGYTFYSNFSRLNEDKVEYTREFIMHVVAQQFDIPLADVWVEPFAPDGDGSDSIEHMRRIIGDHYVPNYTSWASYVKDKHAQLVRAFNDRTLQMLEVLRQIYEQ